MADSYTVSAAKMQELNELINTGGQIPSAVNAATAKTAEFLDQKKINEAKLSNLNASKENDKSGQAWAQVQTWHDGVIGTGGTEPLPPLPLDSIVNVDNIEADGVNHEIKDMRPEASYTYQLIGSKPGERVSYSRPGGWCQIAWGAQPGAKTNVGQAGLGTAILLGVTVPVGAWVTMWLGRDSTPVDDALYSA